MSAKNDLSGRVFGHLKVLHPAGSRNGRALWYCECKCGAGIVIKGLSLVTGNTKSCGCIRGQLRGSQLRTHGESKGYGKSREYSIWCAMKQRCFNPNVGRFSDYGGRGITVCPQWVNSFEQFLKDVGRCPPDKWSLGRIDNDGNYQPGNVRWETHSEQMNNTRRCRQVSLEGKTLNVISWSKELGIPPGVIRHRLERGLPVDRVLNTKVQVKTKKNPL